MRSQFDHLIRDTSDEEGMDGWIMDHGEGERKRVKRSQKVRQVLPLSMGRACRVAHLIFTQDINLFYQILQFPVKNPVELQ